MHVTEQEPKDDDAAGYAQDPRKQVFHRTLLAVPASNGGANRTLNCKCKHRKELEFRAAFHGRLDRKFLPGALQIKMITGAQALEKGQPLVWLPL